MRGRSLGMAGVFGLTMVLLGGCPQPPAPNDNENTNGAANTNANTPANANENAPANANDNQPAANTNDNAPPANSNANSPDNTNQNAPANANDNAPQNANDNSTANANANGNTNSNSNSNTNANDNSGGGGGLSANQQAAVNGAVLRLKALDTVIGVLIPFTSALLEFPDPTAINVFGTCPEVAWAGSGNNWALGLIYDENLGQPGFGVGCVGADMDGLLVAGQVQVNYTNSNATGVFAYQSMTIGGEAVTVNATMVLNGGGFDATTGPIPLTYNGSFGGNVAGDETFGGNLSMSIRNHVGTVDPALVTINATGYSLGQTGQTAFNADLAGIVVDVLGNASFTPEAGTLTFTPAGEPQIVITFNAQSPASGTVQVSVGGAAAVAHVVPGAAN